MSARPQTAEAAIAVIARVCASWRLVARGVRLERHCDGWTVWVHPVPTEHRTFSVFVVHVDGVRLRASVHLEDPDVDLLPGLLAALGAPNLALVEGVTR